MSGLWPACGANPMKIKLLRIAHGENSHQGGAFATSIRSDDEREPAEGKCCVTQRFEILEFD